MRVLLIQGLTTKMKIEEILKEAMIMIPTVISMMPTVHYLGLGLFHACPKGSAKWLWD
jgi:hypothetical protein